MDKELTLGEFSILTALAELAETDKPVNQRQLAQSASLSPATVNRTLRGLVESGYVKEQRITGEGLERLEPYRVRRAVFIAAGFGSRLVPITLNTPKPLVRVHGKRIIDGLLDAVLAAGIREIYIVRGYLAEQFDQLLYKYPMIHFLENPAYNETNNISSALCARYYLGSAYVFEADLLINRPSLIQKYQYSCNYLGFPVERTDDWCFDVKGGLVQDLKQGGTNCWQTIGISYWDEASGRRLSGHLEQVYNQPGGKELLWDMVAVRQFHKEYQISVRPCKAGDFTEIDTFRELKAVDQSYDV